MKIAKKFLISGRVQGVGYRWFAEEWGNGLGLAGYVKNRADGRVEAYAVGVPERLRVYKAHLEEGPAGARVTGIEESESDVDSTYKSFRIEGSW